MAEAQNDASSSEFLQSKAAQKRLQDTENLFRKNLQVKDDC